MALSVIAVSSGKRVNQNVIEGSFASRIEPTISLMQVVTDCQFIEMIRVPC